MRAAFINIQLPQTIATMNNNTGKIEVGLVEEVYTDKENTDMPIIIKSAKQSPFVISIGIMRNSIFSSGNNDSDTQILLDPETTELNCID